MQWSKKEYKTKVGVLAFSMGTLIAALGHNESSYDFLIGEAFIKSPSENKSRIKQLKKKSLKLPHTVEKDEQLIQALEIPMLLFASNSDPITTLEDSIEFFSSRPRAEVIAFEGDHLRGAATLGMGTYIQKIKTFIEDKT